ncbi:MAG: zinc-ribbon domain containing protein [Chloroflexi bacterium]|nr:zinc-ribbon domain containing protein [Chloroflexota bacterium]
MKDLRKVDFQDKQLTCTDCDATFTFTKGERFYYASKGLCEPKRCPNCRLRRKLTLVREGGEL